MKITNDSKIIEPGDIFIDRYNLADFATRSMSPLHDQAYICLDMKNELFFVKNVTKVKRFCIDGFFYGGGEIKDYSGLYKDPLSFGLFRSSSYSIGNTIHSATFPASFEKVAEVFQTTSNRKLTEIVMNMLEMLDNNYCISKII